LAAAELSSLDYSGVSIHVMVDERSVLQTAERPETVRENQQWTLYIRFTVVSYIGIKRVRYRKVQEGKEGGRDGWRGWMERVKEAEGDT
jgi:hypothetical protein